MPACPPSCPPTPPELQTPPPCLHNPYASTTSMPPGLHTSRSAYLQVSRPLRLHACMTSRPPRSLDLRDLQTSRPPDLHDFQTSRPLRLYAYTTSRPPCLQASTRSRPPDLCASIPTQPPALPTFMAARTQDLCASIPARPPGLCASMPTRAPDLVQTLPLPPDLQTSRPSDLHTCTPSGPPRPLRLYAYTTSMTYTTSRRLHLLHMRHLHKHNQAGREEKPRHSDGGQDSKHK
jgi:hypothetical protein